MFGKQLKFLPASPIYTTVNGFIMLRCGPCGGSGGGQSPNLCVVCDGEGKIVLRGKIENYRDCPNCKGSGYLGFDTQSTCEMCKGLGAVPIFKSTVG